MRCEIKASQLCLILSFVFLFEDKVVSAPTDYQCGESLIWPFTFCKRQWFVFIKLKEKKCILSQKAKNIDLNLMATTMQLPESLINNIFYHLGD